MWIELDGWAAKLRFSACHVIPDHPKCGKLHGHTYAVSVKVEGSIDGEFVIDFNILKTAITTICDELDHRIIIAEKDSRIKISHSGENIGMTIIKSGKQYSFPEEDVVLIPTPSVSAESLCIWFSERIAQAIKSDNLAQIHVRVDEGAGQGAGCTHIFKE